MGENGGRNRYQGNYVGDLSSDLQAANAAWLQVGNLNEPVWAVASKGGGGTTDGEGAEESVGAEVADDVASGGNVNSENEIATQKASEINAGGLGEGDQAQDLRNMMQGLGASVMENVEAEQGEENSSEAEQEEGGEQTEVAEQVEIVERDEGDAEQAEAERLAARETAEKNFAEWQEWIAGTVDGFWEKLQDKEWSGSKEGIVIGDERPQFNELREKLMEGLSKANPRVKPEALQVRLDLATKMALERFAEEKAQALRDAKVQPRGLFGNKGYKRVMPKTYDQDLEKVLQGKVYGDVSKQYVDHADLLYAMQQGGLSRREQLAWWQMMRPEEAQDLDAGMGERTPFEVLEKTLPEPTTPEKTLQYYDGLHNMVTERMAVIADSDEMVRDRFGQLLDDMVAATLEVMMELHASISRNDRLAKEYDRMVSRDNLAVETLRSRGLLPREGEISEQLATLDQIEEETINKMSEAIKTRQDAERVHDLQTANSARIEYNEYQETVKNIFAAKRALKILSAEGTQAQTAGEELEAGVEGAKA